MQKEMFSWFLNDVWGEGANGGIGSTAASGMLKLQSCVGSKVVGFGDHITLLNVKYVSCRDLDNNGDFDVI